MIETSSVAMAPKTSTFQMRINVQGLPVIATSDSKTVMKEQEKTLLMKELEKGLKSAKEEGWISEKEMWKEFGDTL